MLSFPRRRCSTSAAFASSVIDLRGRTCRIGASVFSFRSVPASALPGWLPPEHVYVCISTGCADVYVYVAPQPFERLRMSSCAAPRAAPSERRRYICFRSGWGYYVNVYDVLRGLRDFCFLVGLSLGGRGNRPERDAS